MRGQLGGGALLVLVGVGGAAAAGPSGPQPEVGSAPARELSARALKEEELGLAEHLAAEFPGEVDPLVLLGMVHCGQGRYARAEAYWRRGLERDSSRADIYVGLARVRLLRGESASAARLLRRALEIDPGEPEARGLLARALLDAGEPREAIAAAEAGSALKSPRAALERAVLLGQAWLAVGDLERARQHFEAALRLRPDDERACYGMARACAQLGQEERAAALLEKFREMKAEGLEARMDRAAEEGGADLDAIRRAVAQTHVTAGAIYRAHGDAGEAEKHLRRAASLDPENVECRGHLVALYHSQGRTEEALAVCRELCRLLPRDARVLFQTAALQMELGRRAEALENLRRAAELDPSDEEIRRALRALERER